MVTWPSGKARVCKTLIHQFKSGRHLQKIPGSFGFRDFLFLSSLILEKHSSAHFCGIAGGFARWQQRLHGGHHGGGLCAAERRPLSPVYAYRDSRTQLEKAIVAYIDYYNRRIK